MSGAKGQAEIRHNCPLVRKNTWAPAARNEFGNEPSDPGLMSFINRSACCAAAVAMRRTDMAKILMKRSGLMDGWRDRLPDEQENSPAVCER